MIRNIKNTIFILASLLITGTGCKKFLDVNQNLNAPLAVPTPTLLTTAQNSLGNTLSLGNLSGLLAVYTHQMSTREAANAYGIKGSTVNSAWDGLYAQVLPDLDVMISQGTTEGNMIYVGIAKILRAYTFSQIVDVWGDAPFSEFNQFPEINQPKFDDDATIYPKLFALLDSGISDIRNKTAKNLFKPGANDIIYKGDTSRWIKAANTIKLKLYTQIRKIQNVTPQVTALLATPGALINSTAESFLLPYGPLGAVDDRNPGFGDYVATQRSDHVSPWFYEILKGFNTLGGTYPNPLAGIADPRIKYYIFNQLKPGANSAQSNTEYRDGPFISIYFGSAGRFRDGNQQNSISLFGIYPVGGRYDDGNGGTAGPASGTGAAPYRFITYADRLYLEAELIQAGVIPGNAKTVFTAAMNASMDQVDYTITTYVKPAQTVPLLVGAATTSYINSVLLKYDAGTAEKKLEYIMLEKWLSSVGSSVDQYTDYRRTGYPVLFNPSDPAMAPGGLVQPPLNGNPFVVPQEPVPVVLTVSFPLSLPWPQKEIDLNSNAPAQKLPSTYKVFWMP